MKTRLAGLVLCAVVAWAALGHAATWEEFKADFVSADGRVIDRMNDDISHSEGQGYAMLLAVVHQDRLAFETLWHWTENNLQVRGIDSFLAWKWGRRNAHEWGIVDLNNATDGDLLVAWALLRAGQTWSNPSWIEEAHALAAQILSRLRVRRHDLDILLPGFFGFDHPERFVVNPSYMVFPAWREFALAWPDQRQQWNALTNSGLTMLERCAFTRLGLPPDWALLRANGLDVDAERSPWFGYDAIRVPLYLTLAGQTKKLLAYAPFLDLIERLGYLPRQVDLIRSTIHLESGPAGFWAVMARVAHALGRDAQAERLRQRADEMVRYESKDYYSRVLVLLAAMDIPAAGEQP